MPWFAYFYAVVNATIIGFSFLFVKITVSTASPIDTLAFRFLVAAAACFVYGRFMKIPLRFSMDRLRRLLPLALFYPIGFFTFQAYGLLYTTSGEAGILTAAAPMITAVCAAFFIAEHITPFQALSILLSVSGVVLIAVVKGSTLDPDNIIGILLILFSCFASAGYTITNRVLIRSFSAMEITVFLMLIGALFFSGISLGTHLVSGTLPNVLLPFGNPLFFPAILFLGLLSSLLTTILTSLILKRLRSAQLAVFLNLSTVISIVAGYLVLHEPVRPYHLLGAALIILGVLGTNLFARREEPPLS